MAIENTLSSGNKQVITLWLERVGFRKTWWRSLLAKS